MTESRRHLGRQALRVAAIAVLGLLAVGSLGCRSTLERTGILFLYRDAPLPRTQAHLDLAYRDDLEADPEKHRLDLFLPAAGERDWPTLVFVHGGGWTHGDRAQVAGGADLIRNIGRHFATQGVASAVLSYRLQPGVTWREQLEDVAAALRFVREQVAIEGGNPDALYLSGHSAGSWLAARVGYDDALLQSAGVPPSSICGLALVSGAAYDLADQETYDVGANRDYFVERFDDGSTDWEVAGSVVPLLRSNLPPTLILYGSLESKALRRQSELLYEELEAREAPVSKLELGWQTHETIVLTLSREDKRAVPAILDLMQTASCPARPTAG